MEHLAPGFVGARTLECRTAGVNSVAPSGGELDRFCFGEGHLCPAPLWPCPDLPAPLDVVANSRRNNRPELSTTFVWATRAQPRAPASMCRGRRRRLSSMRSFRSICSLSSRRHLRAVVHFRRSSSPSSVASCVAAFTRTGSTECAVARVGTSSQCRFPARVADSVRRAADDTWLRQRRIWWTMFCLTCRTASGS
jgi:hypothetical protein